MTLPAVSFRHLLRLSDEVGLLEHAEGIVPRHRLGYCVDDVARGLIAVCRAPAPSPEIVTLARRYLYFVANAQAPDGRFRNRLGYDRRWKDVPSVADCWGRALWGLGTAAVRGPTVGVRTEALTRYECGLQPRSPWPHAMAFAALGAAAVLDVLPDHEPSLELLADAARTIGSPASETWPWPLPRLTYANAALAEAVIAAGSILGDEAMLSNGLHMLRWLLALQTREGPLLSVIPAAGYQLGDSRPGFDQQPIEVAALADACQRAALITHDAQWLIGVELCVAWFLGVNDATTRMFDEKTGGGCDGLTATGRNRNQGAESTIAAICTLQLGHALGLHETASAT